MQVIVDGLSINYLRQGRGKTILLIHGWANSLIDLEPLASGLKSNFDVISIDLPGFGGSQTPNEVWGLNEYADFIAKFVSKVGVKDLYSLIGHSYGGAIAIKALSANKLSADKLILIASSGIRIKQQGRLTLIKLVTKTGKIASTPLPQSTKKRLRAKLYKSVGSDLLAAEHMSESFKRIVGEDLQVDAKKISTPTLLIYGEEDKDSPVVYGELYHQLIDGSTLEVLSGGGHFIHKEMPAKVVRLIKDFLC